MFNSSTLTLQEHMMAEPLPLAAIQKIVLDFLKGRDDAFRISWFRDCCHEYF